MNYIFYDVIAAALLLFFLWRGYRKGLVLTLCGLLAVFVAFLGASVLSSLLAEPVAKAIEPVVTSSIHDTVTSYYQRSPAENTSAEESDWLSQLPLEELLAPLKDSKLFQGFADAFQEAVDDGVADIAASAAKALAHYVAVHLARTVLFTVLFAVILVAWSILSRSLDLVAKLPVLNTVNRWTGAAVGLAEGTLLVFIACWLLKDSYLSAEAVRGTYLLQFFCTHSPLDLLPSNFTAARS